MFISVSVLMFLFSSVTFEKFSSTWVLLGINALEVHMDNFVNFQQSDGPRLTSKSEYPKMADLIYFNYEDFHYIIHMTLVDADCQFIRVDVAVLCD